MTKKLLLTLLVLGVLVGVTQAGLITGIERRNSEKTEPEIAGPLVEDALTFVDRDHEYNAIPAYLIGAEYVKVANDDKKTADYELDVTLASDATIYLFLDNRLGHGNIEGRDPDLDPDLSAAGMDWVIQLGFEDTGDVIGIDEHGNGEIDQWSSVFAKSVSAGTITLLQQKDKTGAGGRNMYGVAVVPEPTTIALLGFGGLALLRRRKG